MTDLIPPGLVYLAQWFPHIAGPPTATYLLTLVAESHGADIPAWVARLALALSLPLALTIKVQWSVFKDKRDAARMGARLPPVVPDPIPGGLSFILNAGEEMRNAYPGASEQR